MAIDGVMETPCPAVHMESFCIFRVQSTQRNETTNNGNVISAHSFIPISRVCMREKKTPKSARRTLHKRNYPLAIISRAGGPHTIASFPRSLFSLKLPEHSYNRFTQSRPRERLYDTTAPAKMCVVSRRPVGNGCSCSHCCHVDADTSPRAYGSVCIRRILFELRDSQRAYNIKWKLSPPQPRC